MKNKYEKGEMLYYFIGLLIVSVLNIGSRFLSTIFLSNYYGVDYELEMVLGVLPVMSFSESNIIMFRTISSLSLVVPALLMFVLFYIRYFRKKAKVEWKRDATLNIWLFGLYLTFIQYGIALFLDERIQFANDWRGAVFVLVLVYLATNSNMKNLKRKKS